MNPNNLLHTSKQEQRGTLVMVGIVILALVINQTLPVLFIRDVSPNDSIQAELNAYMAKLSVPGVTVSTEFRPFDPNTVPEEELKEMGLTSAQASNWVNYRNAGGAFTSKVDILKLYAVDSALYLKLEPFLVLDSVDTSTEVKGNNNETLNQSTPAKTLSYANLPQMRLEINAADSAAWVALPGIGAGYSRRIIKYRNLLGGFHSEDQLLEVWGIDTMTILGLMPVFEVDTTLIEPINLNEVGLYKLKAHPYITMELANQIIKSRYYDGDFESPVDLLKRGVVNREYYPKIAPYISVK